MTTATPVFDERELKAYKLHKLFPLTDFSQLDRANIVEHVRHLVRNKRNIDNCILGLMHKLREKKCYHDFDCTGIVELGNKFGYSVATVKKVLRIGRKLADKPVLNYMFQNGQLEWTKLDIVVRHVNKENQCEWLHRLHTMRRKELKVYVAKLEGKPVPASAESPFSKPRINVSAYYARKIRAIYRRYRKNAWKPVSLGRFIVMGMAHLLDDKELLSELEREFTREPEVPGTDARQPGEEENFEGPCPTCGCDCRGRVKRMNEAFEAAAEQLHKAAGEKGYPDILSDENGRITVPRHIPAAVKRYVTGDLFGGKCANRQCRNKGEVLHHIDGFSSVGFHHPHRILYLCKDCEKLLHSGALTEEDMGFEAPISKKDRAIIDIFYRQQRLKAWKRKGRI